MSDRTKDVLIRAGKTFLQSLIATAMTQLIALFSNDGARIEPKALLVTVGLPSLAAGMSAVQNILFPAKTENDSDKEQN